MGINPPKIGALFHNLHFSWESARAYTFILLGSLIQALAMRLFMVPADLVSGGISGAAQLINHYTGWPIGFMVLIGNIPLFILGWRYLGGVRFALRTAVAIASFSFFTDILVFFIPAEGVTNDILLNTLYGGLVLGIGLGLVYRGQGTSGGSDILGRILNHRMGISISQSYLVTDSLVVLLAGFVFGWTKALYGLVLIYVSGLAAEISAEGSDILRSTMIVTARPEAVSKAIMDVLERGVTIIPGTGAYTRASRPVLYCVVTRSEVSQLRTLVHENDPAAFMVIGTAHEALGEGFKPLKPGNK
ncbi:MAG TPA: YitT family protein [Anaerolineaceae bacterium]|nr:YitT family protein [Anaerolineaceae bacterium]HPN51199.1 YitT family protein [Anaerolineaceae bacterium]